MLCKDSVSQQVFIGMCQAQYQVLGTYRWISQSLPSSSLHVDGEDTINSYFHTYNYIDMDIGMDVVIGTMKKMK